MSRPKFKPPPISRAGQTGGEATTDKTTSRITKTGEAISVFAIAGVAFAALAAGIFSFRHRVAKKKEN